LSEHCVKGIEANRELLAARVRDSAGLATALNPYIGYENATLIARAALATGRRVGDLVIERGLMDAAQLEAILRPEVLTQPRHRSNGAASGKRLEP
jgi:aspartate ammonia-lyase